MSNIPIIIPAYEPDMRLVELVNQLVARQLGPIVIVDDGSGEAFQDVFALTRDLLDSTSKEHARGTVLVHAANQGKGAALKNAFSYVLDSYPDALGVVTADSDGQHTPSCIERVREALIKNPHALVLGTRDFDAPDVPPKSRVGNRLTSRVFHALTGIAISDTQTGLRGIPHDFMATCLGLSGNRFEFETQMLSATQGKLPIVEVPIQTVYDSKEHHQTHYRVVVDSARICKVLIREPLAFAASSLASCAIDLAAFALLCAVARQVPGYVALCTVAARLISATFNFLVNSRLVFKSQNADSVAAPRYVALAVVIMALSAGLTTAGTMVFSAVPEVLVKVVVDAFLFALSFTVQKRVVF